MATSPGGLRLWPTLGAAAGIAITVALGMWQLGRGDEKARIAARTEALSREPPISVPLRELAAHDVELRRVEARGTFEPKYMVLLDNRVHNGKPGYHVVMPLKLEGGDRYVLVNRGWIAGALDRKRLPQVPTPREPLVVRGRAVLPGQRFLELSSQVAEGQVWQNLTLERYRAAMPIAIQPFMIQQDAANAPQDGLVRDWEAPPLNADKHYGYAFQWFSLSALILVFYLATHVRGSRKK